MHTDPISDMLTRIRNAQAVKKADVWLPYSKLKSAILEILAEEGYISGFQKVPAHATKLPRSAKKIEQERNNFDQIRILLKYDDMRRPMIREVKRISKPGRRVYVGHLEIPSVLSGMGIAVLSTPRGMMTNRQARKEGIGGEIICEVY